MINNHDLKQIRYEKKWIYKSNNFNQLILKLKRSKLHFKSHYTSRLVNSIYFDNNKLKNINDNLEGERNRLKYRVRWYGSEYYIQDPFFEIKYKDALKTFKKRTKINLKEKLKTNNYKNYTLVSDQIEDDIFKSKILNPKIHISYKRTYLISSNNLIRATIDQQIKFKKIGKFNPFFFQNFNNIILEMKYDLDLDDYFRKNLNEVHTRYSKSSKYINCMLIPSREFSI